MPTRIFKLHLGKRRWTTVDEDDYIWAVQYKWSLSGKGYAQSNLDLGRKVTPIQLHRLILQLVVGRALEPGEIVDHKNGVPLDNRRKNLRICSFSDNNRNRRPAAGGTSRYKGVCFERQTGRWKAVVLGKTLGRFDTQREAAYIYDQAAIQLFGEFVRTNFELQ